MCILLRTTFRVVSLRRIFYRLTSTQRQSPPGEPQSSCPAHTEFVICDCTIEDSFKVTKECLGWEEVQVLDLRGIRTLVAMAWVAAGFLYQLGGWVPHKDRRPGKITLMRGLRRLLDMLATQAILSAAAAQPGGLPPNIQALLQGWQPPPPDL